jgi:hypothetical protein
MGPIMRTHTGRGVNLPVRIVLQRCSVRTRRGRDRCPHIVRGCRSSTVPSVAHKDICRLAATDHLGNECALRTVGVGAGWCDVRSSGPWILLGDIFCVWG